jgi:hypothetical protein
MHIVLLVTVTLIVLYVSVRLVLLWLFPKDTE